MAFEAQLRHGDPTFQPYTPGAGAVNAGQVVLLGNLLGLGLGIAHQDIANNTLGALAIGGGIYDVTQITNIAQWSTVYWDDTNNKVTTTSTNNATFGIQISVPAGANTIVQCLHAPMTPRV